MKILLFHYDELDELGGVETLVRSMSCAFTELGHPTGVLELGRQWLPRRELMPGVPIWRITGSTFPCLRRPGSWLSFGRSIGQFLRVVNDFDPDVVHVHFPVHQSLTIVGACRLPHRWKLAVTVHNSDIRGEPQKDPRIRLWRDRLFARADAVTAVSDSLLAEARKAYPAIADKGTVIYNGISAEWGTANSHPGNLQERKYVLYAGRLHAVKGVDTLLSAWSRLSDAIADVTLLIVGDGPERKNLEARAVELGITASVTFLPTQSKPALAALYRRAECVVLPSQREGLAMALLEAGACGAICVASNVTGIYEVIEDGVNGLLFPYGDVAALSKALATALRMPDEERQSLRLAAQQRVAEHFTEERMLRNYLDLYSGLMHQAGRKVV